MILTTTVLKLLSAKLNTCKRKELLKYSQPLNLNIFQLRLYQVKIDQKYCCGPKASIYKVCQATRNHFENCSNNTCHANIYPKSQTYVNIYYHIDDYKNYPKSQTYFDLYFRINNYSKGNPPKNLYPFNSNNDSKNSALYYFHAQITFSSKFIFRPILDCCDRWNCDLCDCDCNLVPLKIQVTLVFNSTFKAHRNYLTLLELS